MTEQKYIPKVGDHVRATVEGIVVDADEVIGSFEVNIRASDGFDEEWEFRHAWATFEKIAPPLPIESGWYVSASEWYEYGAKSGMFGFDGEHWLLSSGGYLSPEMVQGLPDDLVRLTTEEPGR